jgi:hypothetical protein
MQKIRNSKMERLTGNDALGLMEAYSAVHQPTINEEQIWEEVENWVNGLIEEGYDLGDYTWEDMYEVYLSEADDSGFASAFTALHPLGRRTKPSQAQQQRNVQVALGAGRGIKLKGASTGQPQGRGYGVTLTQGGPGQRVTRQGIIVKGANVNVRGAWGVPTPAVRSGTVQPINVAGRTLYPAARGRDIIYLPSVGAQTRTPLFTPTTPGATQRPPVTPGATQRPVTPGAGQRPVTPGATQRPVTPGAGAPRSSAIPASPPAPRPTAAAGRPPVTQSRIIPQYNVGRISPVGTPLPTTGIQPVAGAPTQDAQVSAPAKPVNRLMQGMPTVPSMAAPVGGPQLSARVRALQAGGPQGPARARVLNQSFDPFDIVMGHLIDEGYAETEEDAAVIMANMSEEWKESIVEAYVPWDAPRYVWDKGVQVLTGRPSPRDVTAARQTQQTPERAKQLARVQANMRYGMQQVYKRTGDDPAKEGTAPLTPRHIRSAQTVGGTAGGKMYPGPQGKPQPSGIPSIKVPSTPELRRQNTAAQLRQALRTGRGMSGSVPNVGTPSGMPTPSGATGPYYPGSAPGYGIGQTKLAN